MSSAPSDTERPPHHISPLFSQVPEFLLHMRSQQCHTDTSAQFFAEVMLQQGRLQKCQVPGTVQLPGKTVAPYCARSDDKTDWFYQRFWSNTEKLFFRIA